ncbi:FAD-dependent oxidoreductase [Geminocystis sp. GBBB08]|uniref:FAD-dependent oxidoreductase n=1 Tax=Geminocystis sp. GBBB08 TaxID=2604140 RepID=UPI0027E2D9ED|nr:FAD-dependent oxidoreductase [Geminocystis sp. GBBB08]MBL1209091.1 FAD-dependent oxidoreductase [Geminocystis sp. GBBB08]
MTDLTQYDAVVIGGGFFGCQLSIYLKQYLNSVLIIERESDLLQRASYNNQARVHNGYHYPRSILTALRSRISFPRFVEEYRECIDSDFVKYYAIGKIFSKVNANQFKLFCDRIQAPIEKADLTIKKLFNPSLIEEVFLTQEYAFDAVKLKERVYFDLEKAKINLRLNSEVIKLKRNENNELIEVFYQEKKQNNYLEQITTKYLFNCTYSGINNILSASELPTIPLKHELTEMALVEVPDIIKDIGITVMCGPFFSIMPFPSRHLHSLSHVRYTPHCYWQNSGNYSQNTDKIFEYSIKKSNYAYMIRDASRYMPLLENSQYRDSLWEVKTILPQSEIDDSRPILFKKHQGLQNLTCILGGKIDNVYDIPAQLDFLN